MHYSFFLFVFNPYKYFFSVLLSYFLSIVILYNYSGKLSSIIVVLTFYIISVKDSICLYLEFCTIILVSPKRRSPFDDDRLYTYVVLTATRLKLSSTLSR